jgi:hypothetical protein
VAEKLRIREPGAHSLRNPVTQLWERPGIDDRFDVDHPLVTSHPWAFATEAEIAAQVDADRKVTAVRIADASPVETTEAAPGQVTRRTRRTDRA